MNVSVCVFSFDEYFLKESYNLGTITLVKFKCPPYVLWLNEVTSSLYCAVPRSTSPSKSDLHLFTLSTIKKKELLGFVG